MIYMCTHAAYFTPSEFHPVTIFVTLALVFLVVAVVGFFSFGGVGGGGGIWHTPTYLFRICLCMDQKESCSCCCCCCCCLCCCVINRPSVAGTAQLNLLTPYLTQSYFVKIFKPLSVFLGKLVDLGGGGSVINGAYPV